MQREELGIEGDICMTCEPFWKFQNLEPKRLVKVTDSDGNVITTENKQIPVFICPFCDGNWILGFARNAR